MAKSASNYRFLSHIEQTKFLAKLSFATWVNAYAREGMLSN